MNIIQNRVTTNILEITAPIVSLCFRLPPPPFFLPVIKEADSPSVFTFVASTLYDRLAVGIHLIPKCPPASCFESELVLWIHVYCGAFALPCLIAQRRLGWHLEWPPGKEYYRTVKPLYHLTLNRYQIGKKICIIRKVFALIR